MKNDINSPHLKTGVYHYRYEKDSEGRTGFPDTTTPKRIWACPYDAEWITGNWDRASDGLPMEAAYILEDHAQAEVAAAYLDAADFAADTADQGEGSDGVLWADMAQVVDAIESRTPNDAKASLDHLLKAELQAAVAAEREDVAGFTPMPPECAPKGIPLLVAGGIAMKKTGGQWFTGMEEPAFERPIQWEVKWWSPIPQQNDLLARGDTDALERVRQEAKAEALREAAVICNRSYGGSIGDVHKAIIAIIPDQHKEDG